MKIIKNIEIEGKEAIALFNNGATFTYVERDFVKKEHIFRLSHPYQVGLGGRNITLEEFCILFGKIDGLDFETRAMIVDTLGEVDGKKLNVIIGALTMEEWNITLYPKTGELELGRLKDRTLIEY